MKMTVAHLDAETIGACIDHTLPDGERAQVEEHFSACEECYELLLEGRRIGSSSEDGDETKRRSHRRWSLPDSVLAAAAAVVVAAIYLPRGARFNQQPTVSRQRLALVAAIAKLRHVAGTGAMSSREGTEALRRRRARRSAMTDDDHCALERAFRATSYQVTIGDRVYAIRIGELHPALDAHLKTITVNTWAIVTAVNPQGRQLDDGENHERMRALAGEIAASGIQHHPSQAIADAGDWPTERGLLLLGVTRERGLAVGRHFAQAAIVFGEVEGSAQLLWC